VQLGSCVSSLKGERLGIDEAFANSHRVALSLHPGYQQCSPLLANGIHCFSHLCSGPYGQRFHLLRCTGVPPVWNRRWRFLLHAFRELNHGVPLAIFRPGGPASKCRWREPPERMGGGATSSPGASRPRQGLCRPSGAGLAGNQRVVFETHSVVLASRPCGVVVGGFLSMLFVN